MIVHQTCEVCDYGMIGAFEAPRFMIQASSLFCALAYWASDTRRNSCGLMSLSIEMAAFYGVLIDVAAAFRETRRRLGGTPVNQRFKSFVGKCFDS
jgi:hypothetical protein